MAEVTLTGGPMDGETADVEAGQIEVVKDGCTYRHREHDGLYCYSEGEPRRGASVMPPRRGRAKPMESEK